MVVERFPFFPNILHLFSCVMEEEERLAIEKEMLLNQEYALQARRLEEVSLEKSLEFAGFPPLKKARSCAALLLSDDSV